MGRKYLLGNEAIAHACVESGVDFVSGYPGTPSSEVIDVLRVQPDRHTMLNGRSTKRWHWKMLSLQHGAVSVHSAL